MNNKKIDIEEYAAYLFVKKILTKPTDTDAYYNGLIDEKGNIIRDIETEDDESNFTLLDKLALFLRRQLGNRINRLRDFASVYMFDDEEFYNKFILKGSHNKINIKKMSNKLDNLLK